MKLKINDQFEITFVVNEKNSVVAFVNVIKGDRIVDYRVGLMYGFFDDSFKDGDILSHWAIDFFISQNYRIEFDSAFVSLNKILTNNTQCKQPFYINVHGVDWKNSKHELFGKIVKSEE